jgi:hypothetical protein
MIGADEAHNMIFEVVAMLIVQDGKIKALRDYPLPGGVFELGEAWVAGSAEDQQRLETAARHDS